MPPNTSTTCQPPLLKLSVDVFRSMQRVANTNSRPWFVQIVATPMPHQANALNFSQVRTLNWLNSLNCLNSLISYFSVQMIPEFPELNILNAWKYWKPLLNSVSYLWRGLTATACQACICLWLSLFQSVCPTLLISSKQIHYKKSPSSRSADALHSNSPSKQVWATLGRTNCLQSSALSKVQVEFSTKLLLL